MPRGDGTGPLGQGPGTGRGLGTGQGRGARSGPPGRGPSGYCVCPQCGMKVEHKPGVPCTSVNCSKCGIPLTRG